MGDADVYPYDSLYAPIKNVPIASAATAWTDSKINGVDLGDMCPEMFNGIGWIPLICQLALGRNGKCNSASWLEYICVPFGLAMVIGVCVGIQFRTGVSGRRKWLVQPELAIPSATLELDEKGGPVVANTGTKEVLTLLFCTIPVPTSSPLSHSAGGGSLVVLVMMRALPPLMVVIVALPKCHSRLFLHVRLV